MRVCDRCKKGFENKDQCTIKIKGKSFDLCGKCAESTIQYIKSSGKKEGVFKSIMDGL